MRIFITAAIAAACLLGSAATAITPVTTGTRLAQIQLTGPIGQSFTADDTRLDSFGFQFAVANNGATVQPITFELRSGAGTSGSVITSLTANPAVATGRTFTWYDFALTGVTLTVGQVYTALVSSPSSSRLGLIFGPTLSANNVPATGDIYTGGTLVSTSYVDTVAGASGYCATSGACDANFRINALASVPEPETWLSMTAGFLLTGTALRTRRRNRIFSAD